MQARPQVSPSAATLSLSLTLERGGENEMERKHAVYQNDRKSCCLENQITQVKDTSVTVLSINVIHSLENSGDNFS